jgi:peptidoglycan/LPS O-acetylase OafA/YrhL
MSSSSSTCSERPSTYRLPSSICSGQVLLARSSTITFAELEAPTCVVVERVAAVVDASPSDRLLKSRRTGLSARLYRPIVSVGRDWEVGVRELAATLDRAKSDKRSRHVVVLGHVPGLDGLRGIAILLVLGGHAHQLIPGGAFGVDLFFVLSGFLITSLLVSEWSSSGGISLRAFFRRRAFRLLPALVFMLGAWTLAAAVFRPERLQGILLGDVLGLAYLTNVFLGISGVPEPAFGHLWSLAQEEQFYLLWPPLLLLALRRHIAPRVLLVSLLALATAVIFHRLALEDQGATEERLWYMPDTRADPIILGCAAGLAFSTSLLRTFPLWIPTALLPAGLWIVMGHYGLWSLLFPFVSASLLLGIVLHRRWWFARAMGVAPLRYLGRISYGLYLWHWPLVVVLGWRLGIPIAVAVAALSYRCIEQPFLRRKRRAPDVASTSTRPAAIPAPA